MNDQKATSWKTKLKPLTCKSFSFRNKTYLFLILLCQIQKSLSGINKRFWTKVPIFVTLTI